VTCGSLYFGLYPWFVISSNEHRNHQFRAKYKDQSTKHVFVICVMSEHIVQPRIYLVIFLALLVGTGLTVFAAFYDFPGPLNAIVALTIAVIKATLVILFFMHVRYSGRLIWLVIGSALFWLAIMFAITFSDYSSRGWLPISTT